MLVKRHIRYLFLYETKSLSDRFTPKYFNLQLKKMASFVKKKEKIRGGS